MGEMINSIAEFLGMILSNIYMVAPNFGLSIIILTLLVKLVTFPLNNKQIQSARRMQELQPEMKKIQNKYKNDKEKQNKAMMEFMKEHNVNPLAGCLPLLVQFPILIGIFRLLQSPDQFLLPIFEQTGVVFNQYLISIGNFQMIDLLLQPTDERASILYYTFPIIAGATTFIYQKLSMADNSQKMLLYMMPAMITFFSFSFPMGLVLYWIMNNVFSMGQHYMLGYLGKRKEAGPEQPVKKDDRGAKGEGNKDK